jgi:hypothetical protein
LRIKIISDGTPMGARVVNAETGETIEAIHEIEWEWRAGYTAEATIKFGRVEVELEAAGLR